MSHTNYRTFFELLRLGLWSIDETHYLNEPVDVVELLDISGKQSVIGLAAAGLEKVSSGKISQKDRLKYAANVVAVEQQNKGMNNFISSLVNKMRQAGIYTLLIKGQGVAQCYERPLWRSCGDIDLFLSDSNYDKAKNFLMPLASSVEEEYVREKHLGMTIDGWLVELHGSLYSGLSSRIERELDNVQRDTFYEGQISSWTNGDCLVFLLKAENNAFYIFTHILQHFYRGGIGLRQICDWCRLLYHYREDLDLRILESRIKRAGLMSEWKAFGALAVDWLGMPKEAMPMYDESNRWSKKANRIIDFIMMSGNMGHNRDMSHFSKYPYLIRKCVSMGRRISDLINHARIFPLDSLRYFPRIMFNGVRSAMRGE